MSRPLKERIWFWKPELYWHGWKTLQPFFFGDDEFHWKTICIGWTITGRVIIALRPFGPEDCFSDDDGEEFCGPLFDSGYPGWPVAIYDWLDKN